VADERPDDDQLDRPVAEHLIRQAQIAAWCVQRVRHGMSVLLSSSDDPRLRAQLRARSREPSAYLARIWHTLNNKLRKLAAPCRKAAPLTERRAVGDRTARAAPSQMPAT
jgi:hypothetical protein